MNLGFEGPPPAEGTPEDTEEAVGSDVESRENLEQQIEVEESTLSRNLDELTGAVAEFEGQNESREPEEQEDRMEKVENSYRRSKNGINVAFGALGAAAGYSVLRAFGQQMEMDLGEADPDEQMKAMSSLYQYGKAAGYLSLASVGVFSIGHTMNLIRKKMRGG